MSFAEQHVGKLFLAVVVLIAVVVGSLYVAGEEKVEGKTPDEYEADLKARTEQLAESIAPDAVVVQPIPDFKEPKFDPAGKTAIARLRDPNGPHTTGDGGRAITGPEEKLAWKDYLPLRPALDPTTDVGRGYAQVPAHNIRPVQYSKMDVSWVVVSYKIDFEHLRGIMDKMRQKNPNVPDGAPPLLMVKLQRQEVDPSGRPVGPAADVPHFGNAVRTTGYPPNPGKADPAVYEAWRVRIDDFARKVRGEITQDWLRRQHFYRLQAGGPLLIEGKLREQRDWEILRNKLKEELGQAESGRSPDTGREADHVAPGPAVAPPEVPPDPFAESTQQPGQPRQGGTNLGPEPPQHTQPNQPVYLGLEPPKPDPNRDRVIHCWAFDESAEANRHYRYRVQYVLLNPVLHMGICAGDDDDRVAIAAPWSEWTEPAETEPDLKFFVLGGLANRVNAVVMKFKNGEWRQHNFNVEVGRPLGGQAPKRDGDQTITVDFTTGVIPVDLSADGSNIVFVDQYDNLFKRNEAEDKRAYDEEINRQEQAKLEAKRAAEGRTLPAVEPVRQPYPRPPERPADEPGDGYRPARPGGGFDPRTVNP